MDISIFIARVLGLYLLILSTSILINKDNMRATISGVMQNPSLQFVLGLFVVLTGLILVVSHNIWDASWHVLITIMAWLILIKGFLYTAFPQVITKMSEPFLATGTFPFIAIVINFLLGLLFCYFGFIYLT